MTTLRPGQKPPLPQVSIAPAGTATFLATLAAHVPALGTALKFRPSLAALHPNQKDGVRSALCELQKQVAAAINDLQPDTTTKPATHA